MPGKTAKVTITERQQDILRTIQNAPTVSSQLRHGPPSSSWPSTARTIPRSPPKWTVAAGDQPMAARWPTPGPAHASSACSHAAFAGPSSKSSAMSPGVAPPASSLLSRSSKSWPSPASPRRSPVGPSLTGRPTDWPMRS